MQFHGSNILQWDLSPDILSLTMSPDLLQHEQLALNWSENTTFTQTVEKDMTQNYSI